MKNINRARRREPYHYTANGLPHSAAVWAKRRYKAMNRKNKKPPCVLPAHRAARAGKICDSLPALHSITFETRMEG